VSRWPLVTLGEVLAEHKEYIDAPEAREYPKLSVRLYGKGVVLDTPVDGSSLKMKRHQLAKPGQVILSEIWGKKGAIGFVPPDGEGALCTSHFFLFDIDETQLLRGWLQALFAADYLAPQLEKRAFGTTGYASVRPRDLLAAEIPLPPIEEQRRVVEKLNRLAALANDATTRCRQSADDVAALERSVLRAIIDRQPGASRMPLGAVIADIENGWSPQCHPYPAADDAWGVVKLGAVSFGRFDSSENKQLPDALGPKPQYEIRVGDVLISRANTLELVGASVFVESVRPRLMLCDKIFRVLFRSNSIIDGRYLSLALKSPDMRDQIEARATGTSPSMKNIPKSKLLEVLLPVPSLVQQQRLVAAATGVQSQLGKLRERQYRLSAELEALVSASLAQALRGGAVGHE
jgi:type I restriction enzyme S subunit